MRVERSGLLIVTGLIICVSAWLAWPDVAGGSSTCSPIFESSTCWCFHSCLSSSCWANTSAQRLSVASALQSTSAMCFPITYHQLRPPSAVPRSCAVSINVNTANRQVALVKQLLRDYEPDVVLLMEVNAAWITALEEIRPQYPYQKAVPRDDNFGIALYSKLPFTACDTVEWGQAGVPSLVGTVEVAGQRLTIVGTHPLPPINQQYAAFRNGQLEAVAEYLATVSGPKILLGDLNTSPWSYYFGRLLKMTKLVDSSRGRGIAPTWPTNAAWLRIPIDFCLVSEEITILDKQVGADIGSDHFPLIVDLSLAEALGE